MENNKKSRKKSKKTLILIFLIIILIICSCFIIKNRKNNKQIDYGNEAMNDSLKGSYRYDESTQYTFDGNGKGSLKLDDEKFDYTYKIENTELKLDFKDESFRDATYIFTIDGDSLKLEGQDGTIGGIYILKKESK